MANYPIWPKLKWKWKKGGVIQTLEYNGGRVMLNHWAAAHTFIFIIPFNIYYSVVFILGC